MLYKIIKFQINIQISLQINRIFESIGPSDSSNEVLISVSTPPLFDLSFEKTYSGDRTIHIHLDKTRLNISIPFVVELTQFVLDSLPTKRKITDDTLASPIISTDGRRKYRDEKPLADKKTLKAEKQSGIINFILINDHYDLLVK